MLYGEYMTKISETSVAERSLELRRHADGRDIAFLIIPFSATDHMEEVTSLITQTLVEYDICCLRSDQRRMSDDLLKQEPVGDIVSPSWGLRK